MSNDTEVDPGYARAVEQNAVLRDHLLSLRKLLEKRLWSVDRKARSARDRGESDEKYQEAAVEIDGLIQVFNEPPRESLGQFDDGDPPMAALSLIESDGYATDFQRSAARVAQAEILRLRSATP